MHDGWCGKLIQQAAGLKLARPSGYYILDPFAFPTVGERNQESLRRSKHIDWRPVKPARFTTYVSQNAKAGQSIGESARDSVRNRQVEGGYPAVAEPDQKDGSQQECQKQDDRRGDYHCAL